MTSYKTASRQYLFEIGGAGALYIGAMYARQPLLDRIGESGPLGQTVMLLPILPVWGMLAAVVRFYRQVDEYQRLELLQSVSIAAGVSACLFCSYPFAADAFGLKPLSLLYAWPILAVAWGLTTGIIQMRNKAGRE
jgi:hypothetical protein